MAPKGNYKNINTDFNKKLFIKIYFLRRETMKGNLKRLVFISLLLSLFLLASTAVISAAEVDDNTYLASDNNINVDSNDDLNKISSQILNDDQGVDDNLVDEGSGDTNATNKTNTTVKPTKTYITSSTLVVKPNNIKVCLKNSKTKKGISGQKVKITIAGNTYTRTTDKNGLAQLKLSLATKTYKMNIKFVGNSKYASSNRTVNLRYVANPIYTAITIDKYGIINSECLKVFLKNKKTGKAISNQKVNITINKKTYTRTTNSKGAAYLKINLKNQIYPVSIKYNGASNYMASKRNSKISVLNKKFIGKTSYGRVDLIGVIGNRSSKVRIAYVVGLHPIEHQIHDVVYKLMKNKVNMKYAYYVYKITLTKKTNDYSTGRMRGQTLAKKFVVPHVNKQKYNLMIDIHSTTGVAYTYSYFIHVPKNSHKPSMNLAYKTINQIKKIEKNSKMRYWSPASQTSPPYLTLPVMKKGTPTFVFETLTSEKLSQTNKRAKILISAVDRIFG